MKHVRLLAALALAAALMGGLHAAAQGVTYVFPYEGFRYVQGDGETVLTRTNLDQNEAFLASLGTTEDAMLVNYIATGVVLEVFPDAGGQLTAGVADAGDFSDVQTMGQLDESRRAAFIRQFEESGLYETCDWADISRPICLRLTSSAMAGTMPVYTLRYVTLHLGQLYVFAQTLVGEMPQEKDEAQLKDFIGRVTLLQTRREPTPAPTLALTPTPEPTPAPTPGVAQEVAAEGELTVENVPAYTDSAKLTITGRAAPSASVRATIGGYPLGRTTAEADGSFSMNVTLPDPGNLLLTISTDNASRTFAVRYEQPPAALTITDPQEMTFTGESVAIYGVTEPEATVYINGKGNNTNVEANKSGKFSVRIYMDKAGTETFSFRAKAKGFSETTIELTLTRELTEREGLTQFRQKMIEVEYDDLVRSPERFMDRNFAYRGKIVAFADYDGRACALVLVNNVATGVWRDPVYVVLRGDEEVVTGDIVTFYLTGEGMTLPADGAYVESEIDVNAPLTQCWYWTKNK